MLSMAMMHHDVVPCLHDAVDFHSLLHPRAQDTRHLTQLLLAKHLLPSSVQTVVTSLLQPTLHNVFQEGRCCIEETHLQPLLPTLCC